MFKKLLALSLSLCAIAPAFSQTPDQGFLIRNGSASLNSPVVNQTFFIDTSVIPQQLKSYSTIGGVTGYYRMTPAFLNYGGSGAPTSSTDSTKGYEAGSIYYDTVGKNLWICNDPTASAAVWTQLNGTSTSQLNIKLNESDWLGDFVVSGLLGTMPGSSLTMSTPGGVAYLNGIRTIFSSPGSFTYTANKDTYDFLETNGAINHVAETNGSPVPTGQIGLFLQKVVTGSSAITSVTQTLNTSPPLVNVNSQNLNILTGTGPFWTPITVNGQAVTAARTYTLPEVGTNAYFLMSSSVTGTSGDPFLASGGIGPGSFGPPGVANGGTGSRTASGARTNLGAAANGNNSDITQLSGLTAAITPAQGGTGLTSLTAHGVVVGQGTSNVTSAGPGTNAYPLVGNGSSSDPTFQQLTGAGIASATITSSNLANSGVTAGSYTNTNITVNAQGQITGATNGGSGFGGNGTNGAVSLGSGGSYTGPTQINATSWSLPSSQTLTCTGSPIMIMSQGTITVSGIISASGGGGAGGNGGTGVSTITVAGANGAGPGHGNGACMIGYAAGGGGGGAGNTGGAGGSGSATTAGYYVTPGGSPYLSWMGGGSGGGGGSAVTSSGTGGTGGNGGTNLMFIASGAISISATATINNNGSLGGNAAVNGGGGGGGSGGFVWYISQTSVSTASGANVTVNGGNGGNATSAGGGGGGGAGGRIVAWSPTNSNLATSIYSAGTGGSAAGTAAAGQNGGAGYISSIAGTPSLPLMCFMGVSLPTDVASARTWGDGLKLLRPGEISQRELAREYAHGDLSLYAKALTPGFDSEATCLDNDNEVLDNAA